MPILLPSGDVDLDDLADQARSLADAFDRLIADGRQTLADLADAPSLDCWSPTTRQTPALFGLASGHPRIGNNRATLTSKVFAIDPDRRWARTRSRWYRLGDALPSSDGRRN
jgi:hypothetical protein